MNASTWASRHFLPIASCTHLCLSRLRNQQKLLPYAVPWRHTMSKTSRQPKKGRWPSMTPTFPLDPLSTCISAFRGAVQKVPIHAACSSRTPCHHHHPSTSLRSSNIYSICLILRLPTPSAKTTTALATSEAKYSTPSSRK